MANFVCAFCDTGHILFPIRELYLKKNVLGFFVELWYRKFQLLVCKQIW